MPWMAIVARGMTYTAGKQCLLCAARLADQSTETDVCRTHREPPRQVLIATSPGVREVLTLTHCVVRRGERHYAGFGESGRRILWQDGEPVGGGRRA